MSKELAMNIEKEVLAFMKKAGDLAVSMRNSADHYAKKDGSIVTDVDLAISKLFAEQFAEYFDSNKHVLIDEESTNQSPEMVFASDAKYIWTLDPVDGTAQFTNNLPIWGIGIGILKDLKPHMSFIYHPDLRTLYIHNSEKFYKLENAFSNCEKITEYSNDTNIEAKCKFITSSSGKSDFKKQNGYMYWLNPGAISFLTPWVATGGIHGSFMPKNTAQLWDVAMGWSMIKFSKADFIDAQTGSTINTLIELVDENWNVNKDFFIAKKQDFKEIQEYINYDKIKEQN